MYRFGRSLFDLSTLCENAITLDRMAHSVDGLIVEPGRSEHNGEDSFLKEDDAVLTESQI